MPIENNEVKPALSSVIDIVDNDSKTARIIKVQSHKVNLDKDNDGQITGAELGAGTAYKAEAEKLTKSGKAISTSDFQALEESALDAMLRVPIDQISTISQVASDAFRQGFDKLDLHPVKPKRTIGDAVELAKKAQSAPIVMGESHQVNPDKNKDGKITGEELGASTDHKAEAASLTKSGKAISVADFQALEKKSMDAMLRVPIDQIATISQVANTAFKQGFDGLEQDGKLVQAPAVKEAAKAAADKEAAKDK